MFKDTFPTVVVQSAVTSTSTRKGIPDGTGGTGPGSNPQPTPKS